ncbi:hypothetical protein AX16_000761, partial [Volvariella volvacea WC 439]
PIRRHSSSRTNLAISPGDDSPQDLINGYRKDIVTDPATWPAPSSFSWLQRLRLVPPLDWELNAENFQRLLDYTCEMPALKNLHVDWRNPNIQTLSTVADSEHIGESVLL